MYVSKIALLAGLSILVTSSTFAQRQRDPDPDRQPILQERGPSTGPSARATPMSGGTVRWVKAGATATSGCTQQSPCGTIKQAHDAASSGDVVGVMSGNYVFSAFTTSKSGITYQCIDASGQPSHLTCKLQPANGFSNEGTLWTNTGQNVDINDFEVDGRTPNGSNSARIMVYSSPTGTGPVNYNRNHVHHGYQRSCGSGGAGMLSDAYNAAEAVVNFYNNIVHDTGNVQCNQIHNIYFSTVGDIIGNVAYSSGGWGIQGWHDNHDNNIINNTVCNNKSGGIAVGSGEYYQTPKPWTGSVVNNIACNNPYGVNVYGSIASNQKFANNLAYGNSVKDYNIGSQTCTNCLTSPAPKFVDPGDGDYRLQEGSGGIDKGTASGAPATDMDGTVRPQGSAVDIGAYEYKSGGSNPNPPDPNPIPTPTPNGSNAVLSVTATSCDGLPAGALYNAGGTAKVCEGSSR